MQEPYARSRAKRRGAGIVGLLTLMLAGGALAGCGGGDGVGSQGGVTLRSTITRVSGTTTAVQTVTLVGLTAVAAPKAPTRSDLRESGYLACKMVPESLVLAAEKSEAAALGLARQIATVLASIAPRSERPEMLVGCLRALKLQALPPIANA